MSLKRVVITGMGWVTPLGSEVDAVWRRLLAGETGVGPVTRFDASTFKTNFAAEVKDFRLSDHMADWKRHETAGLNTQFALAAASKAWTQSGLNEFAKASGGLNRRRFGVYLGAGEGQLDFDNYAAAHLGGWNAEQRRVDPGAWARTAYERMSAVKEVEQEPNLALSHVASAFGCRGPASNCMTACAASTQAVGEAFEMLRHGEADVMFAGGAHSMIHPLGMTGFIRLTAMSRRNSDPQHAARPFDRTRDGFVMGEGAGMIVLETLDHFLARVPRGKSSPGPTGGGGRGLARPEWASTGNAMSHPTPLAEIVGFGSTADAFRITDIQPDGKGGQGAMLEACRQAGVNPREPAADGRPGVHYISAHGTGTSENDKIETAAVKGVFGPLAGKVPFSSVKSMMGHLIQAAGAVELMTCVQAIRTGWVPPTMNLHEPDPQCDLDYVPNKARDLNPVGGVDVCLSNSFGFGGQNDTVCVRRFRL